MNSISKVEEYIDINQLQHVQIEHIEKEYIVSLIDSKGYEIIKGYGSTLPEALNDLHAGLL